MNANEMSPKAKIRLHRIKIVSLIIQMLIWAGLTIKIWMFLVFVFFPTTSQHQQDPLRNIGMELRISNGQIPPTLLALSALKMVLKIVGMVVMLRLFRLYGRGIIFSGKNITCIRLLGWWLIIDRMIEYLIQRPWQSVSAWPIVVGLLVIFAAWIMDEGRKIQEEQELTV